MPEDTFLDLLRKFLIGTLNLILERVIDVLKAVVWPSMRPLLLTLCTLTLVVSVLIWAIAEDRRALAYSLLAYTLIMILDVLLT